MTIHGDNSRNLSFYYDDDLIDGLKAMMAASEIITGPINLGNPNEQSILTIEELIASLTGSKSKIAFEKIPQDDPGKSGWLYVCIRHTRAETKC